MASTTRVPKTEITGLYGALLKRMTRKMLGSVPEAAEVMWHHPAIFKDMMAFGRKAERWDRLDPGLGTLAAMAAAGVVGCSFCLDLHYFLSRDRGLDPAKARQVPRWRESEAFTAVERRVMAYAEAMSRTPSEVTDEMSAALLEDLGPAGLLELTARAAAMNLTARANVALGIRSQGLAASCGLAPLAAPSPAPSVKVAVPA